MFVLLQSYRRLTIIFNKDTRYPIKHFLDFDIKNAKMASAMETTSVLVQKFQKCSHIDKKSVMTAVPNRLMFSTELFEIYSGPCHQLMASIQSSIAVFIYESIITDNYYIKKNSHNTSLHATQSKQKMIH